MTTALDADPQRRAADPGISAFVTANAGSGKTKTLIDRVARLLLAGAEPETILCVTYTKAAAAEMQGRLYDLLGRWSVSEKEPLSLALGELEGRDQATYDDEGLSRARALFARALETPGGLKIQTIHAFCEKLLRRFPIEAGVSPGFRVLDDSAAAAVAAAARKAVARFAHRGEGAVAEAYARFAVSLDFQAFEDMFRAFETQRGALGRYFEAIGGWPGVEGDIWARCGFPDGQADPGDVIRLGLQDLNLRTLHAVADLLAKGSDTDIRFAGRLRAITDTGPDQFEPLKKIFFTENGEGTAAKWMDRPRVLKPEPDLVMALRHEQDRLGAIREQVRAIEVATDTRNALALAQAYLTAYRLEKSYAGQLDFADLIEKARDLTANAPQAAWVLFKLDGGINHILVDEAQDTAPDQWEIIRALTEDFFSGEGRARSNDLARNMFVVGDEKQSIYSFQGAAPEILVQEFNFHHQRATGAGQAFERVDLLASWRSATRILNFVDAAFAAPDLAAAILPHRNEDGVAEPIRHEAVRQDEGCVDLWDLVVETPGQEREAWTAPLDLDSAQSANRILAERMAEEIVDLVERGDQVLDKKTGRLRPAHYGDVLILVRRRKALFEDILRALKHRGAPVAGADRLALSEHILFDDLLALARFVLFPQDELTLAALLRSPFCDVDDQSLYNLAHGRSSKTVSQNLWDRLVQRADEAAEWRSAVDFLQAARQTADQRPFEFFARCLALRDEAGRTQRARLILRLGSEAEDALEEFLAQVLAAEGRGLLDLESLAAALMSLDITVKREMQDQRQEVRVMTAHGAKGLEAPIVFLPETTLGATGKGSALLQTQDGGFLWSRSKKQACAASLAAHEYRERKEAEEIYRLLYVGLTRARDRLVLCGRIGATTRPENLKGWWKALRDGFEHSAIVPLVRRCPGKGFEFSRFGPDPVQGEPAEILKTSRTAQPVWASAAPPLENFARYASPSDLGEGATRPAVSPLSGTGGLGRFRRGDLIHRLLQILPDLPAQARAEAAQRLLDREPDLSPPQKTEMIASALGVLEDNRFAEVFGPGSRPEVTLAGTGARLPEGLNISGRLDRLLVLPDRVLVVDFKTNRSSPDNISEADPAYLRQMALYVGVLSEIFPGRQVEAALVWTDGPKLMPIPENLIARELALLASEG